MTLATYAAREGMAGQPVRAISEALSDGHRVERADEPGRALSESEAGTAAARGLALVVLVEYTQHRSTP